MDFSFVGRLPASKSILNRLYLVKSYYPDLIIHGDSDCEDVERMKAATAALAARQPIDAGHAGTVFRFMALRASRVSGKHSIRGTRRLLERPHDELIRMLRQLGLTVTRNEESLELDGSGWHLQGDTLVAPSGRSSQFATSVLLNAWELPFDLYVATGIGQGKQKVSEGYWRMSVHLAQQLGMRIDFWDGDFRIPKGQKLRVKEWTAESDVSSAFALAAMAAVGGHVTLVDFPNSQLQPDVAFVPILSRMGVPLVQKQDQLKVDRASRLDAVACDLRANPDLFPVLAALCALSEGESILRGAPQLAHKESDRIRKVAELLRAVGRDVEIHEDGITIRSGQARSPVDTVHFDPDQDHRLAFAAAVLKGAEMNIAIAHPEVVDKSFPEFWNIIGWNL